MLLESLEWREPWWLIGLFVPIGIALWRRLAKKHSLEIYADRHLWPWVSVSSQSEKSLQGVGFRLWVGRVFYRLQSWLQPLVFLAIAWCCLLVALAEPRQASQENLPPERQGMDLMVVIDLSPSMLAEDVYPNRYLAAKHFLEGLADRLKPEDRVGIIAFSGQAHLIAPLTFDKPLFSHYLNLLQADLLPTRGSAVEQGYLLAVQYLQQTAKQSPNILLMTDGRDQAATMPPFASEQIDMQALYQSIFQAGEQRASVDIPAVVVSVGKALPVSLPDVKDPTGKRHFAGKSIQVALDEEYLANFAESIGAPLLALDSTESMLNHVLGDLSENLKKVDSALEF